MKRSASSAERIENPCWESIEDLPRMMMSSTSQRKSYFLRRNSVCPGVINAGSLDESNGQEQQDFTRTDAVRSRSSVAWPLGLRYLFSHVESLSQLSRS